MDKNPSVMNDRHRGCLIGLAVGDAVGATNEFRTPGSFEPITDMVGGGVFDLEPGEWTDDTSMALCLGASLVECRGFDAADQMDRYVRWYQEGYMSSNGRCFDIGNTTRSAIDTYIRQKRQHPECGSRDPNSAGNGSIMRLAPIPMFYKNHPEQAMRYAAASSRTTHGAEECQDACELLALYILRALNGNSKEEVLDPRATTYRNSNFAEKIQAIYDGSYRKKQPPEIQGTGYVVKSLEAVMWAFYHSRSFREGLLLAVNLGDDADTTGAVYGQIAGAYYGYSGIPSRWIDLIAHREKIEGLAVQLEHSFADNV